MSEAAPPIILVHGAWHGPWCWSRVAPLLTAAGREVHTPCLPGHAPPYSAPARISLRHYQQALSDLIMTLDRPVILAGHSMAGMLIASLAQAMPSRISRLVFINAFLPSDGDSVFSLMSVLEKSGNVTIAAHMQLSDDRLTYTIDPTVLDEYFYDQSPPELQTVAHSHCCPQPSLPLAARVRLDEGYTAVPRTCLFSHRDRVIPPLLQRHMCQRQSCQEWLQLDCDHSPFFSMPEGLAAILAEQF